MKILEYRIPSDEFIEEIKWLRTNYIRHNSVHSWNNQFLISAKIYNRSPAPEIALRLRHPPERFIP